MQREIVFTDKAPAAIGPYSQAIKMGNLLFISGQIGFDPATGELVEGDITTHTKRVMDNLGAILEAAGSSFERVCKTTIFITDMNDFAKVNEAYKEYFPVNPPARSCIQVAALPKNAPVEIELIAMVD
ncbi:MAG: RidA family protein [bacterium]|jgi:2-iminobutanoate/2-iminopropanoate deaminase